MQYLGGKSRLARDIAAHVNAERGDRSVWEPFCGGLSVSRELCKAGPIIASDVNVGLVALYQAIEDGWDPPEHVSEETYRAARSLPETDPLRAFCAFGCSFGGKEWGGYARQAKGYDYASGARRGLLRDVGALRASGSAIRVLDFLAIEPMARPLVIYADPPYAGTTGYRTGTFDHDLFWARVQGWERLGVPVLVSEYACPVPHRVVWEKAHARQVQGGTQAEAVTERLFRVRA